MKSSEAFRIFFENYISSFKGLDEGQERNFKIKRDHTYRVVVNIEHLGNALGLDEEGLGLASAIAQFHDLGRFPQLVKYNTFDDAQSEDHAELSLTVLNEKEVLKGMDNDKVSLLDTAIKWHNKFKLPTGLNEKELLFCKLIRDADKLDILKVITDYYGNKNRQPNHTITWDYPESSNISEEVVKAIDKGILVSREAIKNQNDIKVMQMSWVYDLNFRTSFQLLNEGCYMEKIYNSLPKKDEVFDIYRKIKIFTENQLLG